MRTLGVLAALGGFLLLGADLPAEARAKPATSKAAVAALQSWLAGPRESRGALGAQSFASVALRADDAKVAEALLWADHVAHIKATRAAEMAAQVIELDGVTMRFALRRFGAPPATGRRLFISMHGGGGAPAEVNDQQWRNQIRLYEPKEGIYVAPRAPTDTWNLWHQAHIDALFGRLIENLIVLGDVDPDRVYIMGYSAGGDGVYQLAPRMADRLAAAAMMAGHPNETSPLGLRNLPFALQVGERDGAYDRSSRAKAFADRLAALRAEDPGGYPSFVRIHAGKGHWMDRDDAVAVPWMAKHARKPLPDRIVWKQDDVVHRRFYWLAVDPKAQASRALVVATRRGQTIDIAAEDTQRLTVLLSDAMLDLDKGIQVTRQGKTLFRGRVDRTIAVLARTLAERGDPRGVFSSEVTVALEP